VSPKTHASARLNTEEWSKYIYEKKIMRDGVEVDVKVNYLKDKKGNIVTSQVKHWMDEVRMLMYCDLVLKPFMETVGGKLGVWMDNHSAHKTANVKAALGTIEACYLPPNTTAALQILDLLVNGPIKAHIRKEKAQKIFDAFQRTRRKYQEMNEEERKTLTFKMPTTTKAEAITNYVKWAEENLQNSAKMKESITAKFYDLGMAPKMKEDGTLHWKKIDRLTQSINCGTMSNYIPEFMEFDEGPVEEFEEIPEDADADEDEAGENEAEV